MSRKDFVTTRMQETCGRPNSEDFESTETAPWRNTKPRSGVGIPSLGPSLGWLQGLVHRALGLGLIPNLILFLLGILQACNTNPSDKKPNPNHEDLTALPNQKWVARKRDHRGQLKHVQTYDHPPSHQELARYGPGSFSILTTKPNLRLWQSLEIADDNKIVMQRPHPSHPEENIGKSPVSLRGGTEAKKSKKKFTLKRRVRKPSEELPTKVETNVRSDTKDIGSVATSIRSTTTTVRPTVETIVSEPTQESSKETGEESLEPGESLPKERCWKCLETTTSLHRCEFCEKVFCGGFLEECYENHECNQSKVCHKCGRRVPNELVEMAEICHLSFCSLKCLSECRRRNLMKKECVDCTPGSDNENEEKEVDVEMDEGDGYEEETLPEEEESIEEEEVEETCGGLPKSIECKKCQKTSCQGRHCDGFCNKCHFRNCEDRCECNGECKFCSEFSNCEIRCIEAPDRCDKKHCRGFGCEDRWASGTECDEECKGCVVEGCYFWEHQEDGGSDDGE